MKYIHIIPLLTALTAMMAFGGVAAPYLTNANAQLTSSQEVVRGVYVIDIPAGAFNQNATVFYNPSHVSVPSGTTIQWSNDDPNQIHTVTSGSAGKSEAGKLFDSGFMNEGMSFQHTFDKAGDYSYFCQVHPWMTGIVSVGDTFVQGHNFKLSMGTGAVFDFTKNARTLLTFEPTSVQIKPGQPATYKITILKNDQQAFSGDFRSIGGKLYIELVPTDNATRVYGPDISDPIIGAYHISGSFLKDNAAYKIRAELTKIGDSSPSQQTGDEFGIQVVPEFPLSAVGIVTAIVVGVVAAIGRINTSRISKKF
jgi:plastocyanin